MKTLILLIVTIFITGCPSTNHIHTNGKEAPSWRNPLGEATYVVLVKGLVCPACAVGLKKGLMKLPFVRSIHINYNTGMTGIYEKRSRDKGSRELDKARITKAIEDGGYDVDKFLK